MLIRTKIFFTLIIFILIIFFMGVSYSYFGSKQISYFRITEKNIESRELVKAILNIFTEQVKAYDYYVYLHEDSEKITFNEKKLELEEKLGIGNEMSIKELDDAVKIISELNELFMESFGIINRYNRSRAIRRTEKKILDRITRINDELKSVFTIIDDKVKRSKQIAVLYKKRVENYFILFFGVGILLLSIISINMYKTITNPLRKMEQAAKIIGQGNLDYEVEIRDKNEFQNIAESFNQMASDLKEFHIKMTQMGKMAAIGELAGGVAHEINNPLTGILGNAQILLKKNISDEKVVKLLQKIERASIRCRDIVADLLDFSRKEEAEKKVMDINKVIDDTFSFCETEIHSKNIELIKKFSTKKLNANVSPRNIQQAFLNIINNAIQSMNSGGRLVIATETINRDNIEYVSIKFEDTGCGFNEETAKHLFDPFFTTREVGEGTGLGLSLTYRIVKNHKGFLSAYSKGLGAGAIFTVVLPAYH